MTIVEFLTARLDNTERDCRSVIEAESNLSEFAERLLREVEAKRRILARHTVSPAEGDPERPWDDRDDCQYDGEPWPCPDVLDLALPYADHPDYDANWRP